MSAFLRPYATGTGADTYVPMIKAGVVDLAVAADWTPATGDVKVSKDGAAAANIGTLPTYVASNGWKFVFTDSELTAKTITINITDSATKAVEDQVFIIETYGNASSMHPNIGVAMRGTDSAATATALATAQADLDLLTGTDGATLATAQGNYAPAKATDIVSSGAITTSGGAVSTVTTLTGHTAQTGDSYARLGAPAGASVSADIATVDTVVDTILEALCLNNTTIATLALQTSFTLTDGSADNDAYNGCLVIVRNVSTAAQRAVGICSDYTGATKTVTLKADPGIFTMAVTDRVYILPPSAMQGTKQVLDDLTDLAATDIVSDGTALNTTGGVLDRVTLADTTTTNTDMLTVGAIADQVWVEAIGDHSGTAGSTAEALSTASAPTAGEVADAVWVEAIGDHSGTGGSTAEALAAAGGSAGLREIRGSATYNSATKELRILAWLELSAVIQNATAAVLSFKNDAGTEVLADGSFTKAENDDNTWLWTITNGSAINAVKNYMATITFTVGGSDYTRTFALAGQGA